MELEHFIAKDRKKSGNTGVYVLIGFAIVCVVIAGMMIGSLAQTGKILKQVNKLQPKATDSMDSNPALDDLSTYILSAMDQTVDPCEDFYQYACGTWMKNTELPADQPAFVRSFDIMNQQNEILLQGILDDDWPLIGPYYSSCLDMATVNDLGSQPLQGFLQMVDSIANLKDVINVTATYHSYGFDVLFSSIASADLMNPLWNILYQSQGGLGLPNKDFYFAPDNSSEIIRTEYVKHMSRMLQLIDVPEATADEQAQNIFDFEVKLANNSLGPVDQDDPNLTYNKMTFADFASSTPNIDWSVYNSVRDMNVSDDDFIINSWPSFFTALDSLIEDPTNMVTIQYYLKYHAAIASADFLSQPFVDEKFALMKLLTGVSEQPERWQTCVSYNDQFFPELLGRFFVMEYFSGDSKEAAKTLVENLESQYTKDFDELSWMDSATRKAAKKKLSMITNKIGYPDKWHTYDDVFMDKAKYFENSMFMSKRFMDQNAQEINQPVDKTRWEMSPSTVNAYYEPTANEIVFPAAILQPPFFNVSHPNFANYGGIGAVIGHEISHGFDNTGCQFDGTGNLTNWWTDSTKKNFDDRAQCVVDLYSSYEVVPGYHINGELTEGENLADFGGVRMSYKAFKSAGEDVSKDDMQKYFPGFTQDQLFFVSFAQLWCSVQTDAFLEYQAATNPHSASRFRVIGPTSNFEKFWDAFQCKEGTPMHPKDTCRVW